MLENLCCRKKAISIKSANHSLQFSILFQSEMDFGSILCWARNDIGRQEEPCIFHLLPAGKPEPVRFFFCLDFFLFFKLKFLVKFLAIIGFSVTRKKTFKVASSISRTDVRGDFNIHGTKKI